MPIYEYICKDCGKHFEVLTTSSSDVSPVTCPQCHGVDVRKAISAASFRLAGGGSSIPTGALSGCGSKSGFS